MLTFAPRRALLLRNEVHDKWTRNQWIQAMFHEACRSRYFFQNAFRRTEVCKKPETLFLLPMYHGNADTLRITIILEELPPKSVKNSYGV